MRTAASIHGGNHLDAMLGIARILNGLLLVWDSPHAMPLIGIVENRGLPVGIVTLDNTLATYKTWSK